MTNLNIRDYICNELPSYYKNAALDFVGFLQENEITFHKDNSGCWEEKIYYWCKYNDNCICYISINDPDEPHNLWTVWSDDIKSEWLENCETEDKIKEFAWQHLDHCGHCGSCGGGRHKIVFGRKFNDVCSCTFRVDNPNSEDLTFLKKIILVSIKKITSIKKEV